MGACRNPEDLYATNRRYFRKRDPGRSGGSGGMGSVGKKLTYVLVPNPHDHLERTGSWAHAKIQRASMWPIGDIFGGARDPGARRTIYLDLI